MLQFNIDKLLEQKGKSRYWLVKQLDSNYPAVNKLIDNKNTSVRMITMDKLLKIFECEPNDLFRCE